MNNFHVHFFTLFTIDFVHSLNSQETFQHENGRMHIRMHIEFTKVILMRKINFVVTVMNFFAPSHTEQKKDKKSLSIYHHLDPSSCIRFITVPPPAGTFFC